MPRQKPASRLAALPSPRTVRGLANGSRWWQATPANTWSRWPPLPRPLCGLRRVSVTRTQQEDALCRCDPLDSISQGALDPNTIWLYALLMQFKELVVRLFG